MAPPWDESGWRILIIDGPAADRPTVPSELPEDAPWEIAGDACTAGAHLRQQARLDPQCAAEHLDAADVWFEARFDRAAVAQAGEPEAARLTLPGLATLCEAWWNGDAICASSNMHVAQRVLLAGRWRDHNRLLLRFRAVEPELARRRPRPAWRTPMVRHQQLRWLRTTLLGRTPGWSPSAPPVGPWGGLCLRFDARLHVDDASIRTDWSEDAGHLRLAVPLAGSGAHTVRAVTATLQGHGQAWTWNLAQIDDGWRLEAHDLSVQPWWPHTHGHPSLYRLTVTAHAAGGEFEREHVLLDTHLGFRRIVASTDEGRFGLLVNGVRVFCRGACWTPEDTLDPGRHVQTDAVLNRLRDAGGNMVRLPGNMVYPDRGFYDACDSLGILIWHDLMFANMDYPTADADFLASAREEVRQLGRRLQGRPSVAVVCGNSEGSQQAAMWGADRERCTDPFFEHTLRDWIADVLPDVPYWPSSAWGGPAFPHQWNQGTTSYYGVGAYQRPLEDARRSDVSFATECLAFANVPEERTLDRMPGGPGLRVHQPEWKRRSPRDLGAGWDFDDIRDHYLRVVYGVDPASLRYSDHARYLALSRAVTGEVMASAYAEWRRAGSRCQGAIVWFLRDLWAGAGWGVLDDRGQPKACFHYLQRVWQPYTLLLTDEGGSGLYAHVVNDGPVNVRATVEVRAFRADGSLVEQGAQAIEVAAHDVIPVPLAASFDRFVDLNWAYRFGPPIAQLVMARLVDEQGVPVSTAFHFPEGQARLGVGDPGLTAQWRAVDESSVAVRVHSTRFAQTVHFEAPGFVAEDAYFHLEPGGERTVRLVRDPHATRSAPFRGSVVALNAVTPVSIQATA